LFTFAFEKEDGGGNSRGSFLHGGSAQLLRVLVLVSCLVTDKTRLLILSRTRYAYLYNLIKINAKGSHSVLCGELQKPKNGWQGTV